MYFRLPRCSHCCCSNYRCCSVCVDMWFVVVAAVVARSKMDNIIKISKSFTKWKSRKGVLVVVGFVGQTHVEQESAMVDVERTFSSGMQFVAVHLLSVIMCKVVITIFIQLNLNKSAYLQHNAIGCRNWNFIWDFLHNFCHCAAGCNR